MSVLTISDYTHVRKPKYGVGSKANFKISGRPSGIIVQNIIHTTNLEGKKTRHTFMEGWEVVKGKIKDEGGSDYFLVPPDFRDVRGSITIDATAWFIPNATFKQLGMKRNAVDIAGFLHSRKRKLPPPKTHIRRKWKATWKASNVGVRQFTPNITYKTNYAFS